MNRSSWSCERGCTVRLRITCKTLIESKLRPCGAWGMYVYTNLTRFHARGDSCKYCHMQTGDGVSVYTDLHVAGINV